jgi:hypothetical protein
MEQKTNIYKEGFSNAYQKLIAYSILNKFDIKQARKELYKALGINNSVSFSQYKRGKIEPKAGQAAAVEKVFMKYGINESEVWGQ